MRYISTRGGSEPLTFSDVLLAGLAPDGGLYVPEEYPQLSWSDIERMKGWSYHQIAFYVLKLFVGEDISEPMLWDIIEKSYDPRLFGSIDVTPIQPIASRVGLLKLSCGPTLAFKDVALQLLANLMEHVLLERNEQLNILGATSGDTGSAAEEAVRGKRKLRIFMLSPYNRMTPFQQLQMYRIDDPRVFNLVPDGNFDSCQTAVKLVNQDAGFKDKYKIGAVNSINWARIVAQTIYHIYGFTRMVRFSDETMTMVVPSGNFGNALSAYVAAKMGLRMHIVVATNANDVLHEFFRFGVYRVRRGNQVKHTLSPSMDIAEASNFERFAFDVVGRNPKELRMLYTQLQRDGEFMLRNRFSQESDGFRISSGTATDEEVIHWIKLVHNRYGVIVDPHTAVGMKVGLELYGGAGFGPKLFAETAQPAKFEDTIARAIGLRMGVPPSCSHLLNRQDKLTRIEETDPEAIARVVKRYIEQHVS